MTTAQITLTDAEREAIQRLAREQGKSENEVLHDALDRYLQPTANRSDWRQSLARGRGLWKGRTDLPDTRALRDEWERQFN